MAVLYANNATSRLSASITNVATSFSVTAGQGVRFPVISGGDYFYLTLMDTSGNLEVVKVTATVTDTFTVVRGQEGTTARAYSVNDFVELRITKAMLDDFKTDARTGYLPLVGGTLTGAYLDFSNSSPSLRITSGPGTFFIGDDDIVNLGSGAVVATPSSRIASGVAILSTYAYGTSQGDNRTHFGYYTGTSYVNYIRGAATYFDSSTLQIAGNQALHAGNYNGYAPTLTGTGASGSWGISVTGNAATATTLQTARTLTIGSTGKTFNGSANVAWSLAEIGAGTGHVYGYTATYSVPAAMAESWFKVSDAYNGVVYLSISSSYDNTMHEDHVVATVFGYNMKHHLSSTTSDYNVGRLLEIKTNNNGSAATTEIWARFGSAVAAGSITIKSSHPIPTLAPATPTFGGTGIVSLLFDSTSRTTSSLLITRGIRVDGNQVLHAGNYNSYSPTLTGTGASGSWGINVTGSAGSVAWSGITSKPTTIAGYGITDVATSHTHSYLPLSGGTLTGALGVGDTTTATITDQSNYSNPLIIQRSSNAGKGAVILRGSDGIGTAIEFGRSNAAAHWGTYFEFLVHNDNTSEATSTLSRKLTVNATVVNALVSLQQSGNQVLHAGNYSSYAIPLSGGVNLSGTFGLNDYKLYLRTNGDTNHYLWNAADDWEELVAYAGTGFRVASSTGTSLMTFTTSAVNAGVALQQGGNQVLHAGNYSSYALPLSGGVLTGSLTINNGSPTIYLQDTDNRSAMIHVNSNTFYVLRGSGTNSGGWTTYNGYWPLTINLENNNAEFGGALNAIGAITQGGNQVLHAGNYTSYAMRGEYNRPTYDLNNLIVPGNYGIGYTDTNRPGDWGSVIVGRSADVVAQWYGGLSDQFFVRGGNPPVSGGGGTWGSWRTLLHSANYSSYALPLSGGNLSGNLRIAPASSSWAEGLSFTMPSTSTWGGLRWRRERGNNDGNWYVGFTALDSSDDLVFGANNGGSQIDNILRLTKAGVVTNNGNQILHAGNYSSYALPVGGKAADTNLFDGYDSDRFWRLYSDSNMETGVHGGNLNGSNMQYLLAREQVQNHLAFRAPTSYETWNGSAWVSQTVPTDIFRNKPSSNYNGLTVANGTTKVRFTWVSFGYKFWSTLATSGSTNGNAFKARIYTSSDNVNWTERFASGFVGDWPGYHVWPTYYGDGSYPHMRIELEFSWNNGNACTFGDIALWGAYGGYTSLFDWDYNRNITLSGSLTVPATNGGFAVAGSGNITFYNNEINANSGSTNGALYLGYRGTNQVYVRGSNVVLGSDNYSSYALPLSGGTLSGSIYLTNDSANGIFNASGNAGYRPDDQWGNTYMFNTSGAGGWYGDFSGYYFRSTGASNWLTISGSAVNSSVALQQSGNQVLHAGNYGSYALSLGGGSVNGVSTFVSNLGSTSGSLSSPSLQVYCTGGNSAFMSFHRSNAYAVNMGLDSDNVLRIGGWSASANRLQMDMSGNLTMAGNVTAYSDERLKKDWAPVQAGFVEALASIKSGTYTRIDSDERQAGVSAQDFQKILPETISTDNEGTLSLAYGNAALVSAVELAKKIVEQEKRIAHLESLISKLIGD